MEFLVIAALILGGILLVVGLTAGISIYNGWALSTLWGWFVVPFFHLPPISIPQAIGISLIITLLTHQYKDVQEKEREGWQKAVPLISVLSVPVVSVFIGWIVKTYFMGGA